MLLHSQCEHNHAVDPHTSASIASFAKQLELRPASALLWIHQCF